MFNTVGLVLVVALGASEKPKRLAIICPGAGDPAETVQFPDGTTTTNKVHWQDVDDGDIDGDGKQDMKGQALTDEEGNEVVCWCLQASPKHGQMIYCLKISRAGKKEFFGGCFFPEGHNGLMCPGARPSRKGPTFVKIGEVEQINIEEHPPKYPCPPGKDQPEIKDYHFEKHADGTCESAKSIGKWVCEGHRWFYRSKEVEGSNKKYPCPDAPGGVVLPVVADAGNYQGSAATCVGVQGAGGLWSFRVAADVGFDLSVMPGDKVWIGASRVTDATVTGFAATVAGGAWYVSDVDPDGVEFTAGAPSQFVGLDSFELTSTGAGGWGTWTYEGSTWAHGGPTWGPREAILRWDVDLNGVVELTDPIRVLGWLFTGGPAPVCPSSADWNDDGAVDLSDVVSVLGFLYLGHEGPDPAYVAGCEG